MSQRDIEVVENLEDLVHRRDEESIAIDKDRLIEFRRQERLETRPVRMGNLIEDHDLVEVLPEAVARRLDELLGDEELPREVRHAAPARLCRVDRLAQPARVG